VNHVNHVENFRKIRVRQEAARTQGPAAEKWRRRQKPGAPGTATLPVCQVADVAQIDL